MWGRRGELPQPTFTAVLHYAYFGVAARNTVRASVEVRFPLAFQFLLRWLEQ
jgi:hypothetical protein